MESRWSLVSHYYEIHPLISPDPEHLAFGDVLDGNEDEGIVERTARVQFAVLSERRDLFEMPDETFDPVEGSTGACDRLCEFVLRYLSESDAEGDGHWPPVRDRPGWEAVWNSTNVSYLVECVAARTANALAVMYSRL